MIQFEDFASGNAFRLLRRYRGEVCCFNDDIQGTAAVALAGLFSGLRITGGSLRDQTLLFFGAGEAGIGIGDLVVTALEEEGLSRREARRRCWFMDSKGLVVRSRRDLADHKRPYAHEHSGIADLESAARTLRPTALIGVAGRRGAFTKSVLELMAEMNERPIVFALSNPTSKAECSAAEAWQWTDGRAIFASGSPFEPVSVDGGILVPGQGNNAYVFPGLGLGVVLSGARRVTDEMFSVAARCLAGEVDGGDLDRGCIYPSLTRIRDVSAHIAAAVAEHAWARGLATVQPPPDVVKWVKAGMYEPNYPRFA